MVIVFTDFALKSAFVLNYVNANCICFQVYKSRPMEANMWQVVKALKVR